MQIDVRANIKGAIAHLNRMQRQQIPFATAQAINTTIFEVREAEIREIRDVFNNPTAYTLKFGVEVDRRAANKHNLRRTVRLGYGGGKATPPQKYLAASVQGGARRLKRFERALRSVGVLPSGMYAVPGAGAQLDTYGNIKPSQIVQILSYFKAFPEAGYKANMLDKTKARLAKGTKTKRGMAYFVINHERRHSHLPQGVWQRTAFGFGSAIKPVLIFVSRASYEAIFDFHYVAQKTVERRFRPNFDAALQQALATAK
jgi:hypothetical protein